MKFLSTISVHGIARIVKTDNVVVMAVWSIMIAGSVSFGLYNISRSINDFSKYDVITNVKRTESETATFPAITICTKYYYRYQRRFNTNTSEYHFLFDKSLDFFVRAAEFTTEKKYVNRNLIRKFNIPKSFGNCVRFNGWENRTLEIVETYTDIFKIDVRGSYPINNEIYQITDKLDVYISDNYLNSYLYFEPLKLESKNKDHVLSIIKAEIESRLGEPYNNCTQAQDITYRQMNCIEECINKEIKNKYNCSIPSYYTIAGLQTCGGQLKDRSTSQSEHTRDKFDFYENHMNYVVNLTNEFYYICEKICPLECETVRFDTRVVTSALASNSPAIFSFSMSDFSTLKITQIPKTILFSFISNIGGILGLFIGMSFLSFAEIFEFLINVIFIFFN